ncbi:TMEM165/GDT1 family protein [Rhizorhapis suberifaciens]|uniref:GDT1 family protein n=1 Tax=Rhizorhapis suberifaciens TaxID=13656 RepID=A0A840HSB6_9SPHN|nr:TMEM165/GDT1 family protein [Rhizorhapis suberifaciens]MBB4640458.1 putative Ca2+/H+ antiporter (TMEM165/GDT1 family) [Rhizorhapis suberifaciens]
MDAFLTSTAIVALAEMGDKTQLLAILLASRFRKPLPISLGILGATLANHFLAALAGQQIASLLDSEAFRYAVAAGFIAMAIWTLIPDKMDDDGNKPARFGAFVTTLIAFFIVEMGDKTQVATIALGAQFGSVVWVTTGTTLGMMIANVPAVLLGDTLVKRIPMRVMHLAAAALFLALGIWMIAELQGWLTVNPT